MDMPLHERRQIENEMIFRRLNEKIGDQLEALDSQLIEHNHPEFIQDKNMVMHFRCECSDENCNARIPIQLGEYQAIHEDRSAFIIKHDHQVEAIEEIIQRKDTYSVVKKHNSTAEPDGTLNRTSIDNS